MPIILLTNSSLKPFITDITTIKVATPNNIPIKENSAVIDINFSLLFAFKYLKAIKNSKLENIIYYFVLNLYILYIPSVVKSGMYCITKSNLSINFLE